MGRTDFPPLNISSFKSNILTTNFCLFVFRERMGLTEAEAVGKMWSGVKAMIQVNTSWLHPITWYYTISSLIKISAIGENKPYATLLNLHSSGTKHHSPVSLYPCELRTAMTLVTKSQLQSFSILLPFLVPNAYIADGIVQLIISSVYTQVTGSWLWLFSPFLL